jgi:hypothetical protein
VSLVTRLHCDGCHREFDWYVGGRRDVAPAGWHYWTRTEEDGDGVDDAHLCSWSCLVVWVHRRRPVAHERVPMRVVAS